MHEFHEKVSIHIHGFLRILFAFMVVSCPFSRDQLGSEENSCVLSITNGLDSIDSRDGPLHNALVDLSLTKDPDSTVFYVRHTYVQYICTFNSHLTGRYNIERP